jgi:hypothetical protein
MRHLFLGLPQQLAHLQGALHSRVHPDLGLPLLLHGLRVAIVDAFRLDLVKAQAFQLLPSADRLQAPEVPSDSK